MGHPSSELDYAAGGRIVITRMSVWLIPHWTNLSTQYENCSLGIDRVHPDLTPRLLVWQATGAIDNMISLSAAREVTRWAETPTRF
jgi:hypothetical protein